MRRLVWLTVAGLVLASCGAQPRRSVTPARTPALTTLPHVTPLAPGGSSALPSPSAEGAGGFASPDSVPTPTFLAPPLGADLCTYDLLFVSDLTVPDGTLFRPGDAIDKRWKVRNSGACAWGPEFRLVLVDGDPMGAPSELALYPALSGTDGIVRAQMIAPQQAGDYVSTWQARDPQGNLFGNKMWVRVSVVAP